MSKENLVKLASLLPIEWEMSNEGMKPKLQPSKEVLSAIEAFVDQLVNEARKELSKSDPAWDNFDPYRVPFK